MLGAVSLQTDRRTEGERGRARHAATPLAYSIELLTASPLPPSATRNPPLVAMVIAGVSSGSAGHIRRLLVQLIYEGRIQSPADAGLK